MTTTPEFQKGWAAGYEAAKAFYARRDLQRQAEINDLHARLEQLEREVAS